MSQTQPSEAIQFISRINNVVRMDMFKGSLRFFSISKESTFFKYYVGCGAWG